jgi:hypothetical protein
VDRFVSIKRVKRDGVLLIQPEGTFKGYGAYVHIHPIIALPRDTLPSELGSRVVEFLAHSGPTGFHIRDHAAYRDTADDRSQQIRKEYLASLRSTRDYGRRFDNLTVEHAHRAKSWLLTKLQYDAARDMLVKESQRRVRMSAGTEALGAAVLEMIPDTSN